MGFWLLVFFLTPILEMYLLIRVGGYIGAWPTIALVALTAVAGVSLLRVQGLATLTRGMSRLEGGELPAREVVEGLLLAVAGVLLVTPGFVTDALGFLLLMPVTRGAVARRMLARVVVVGADARSGGEHGSPGVSFARRDRSRSAAGRSPGPESDRGQVIEGEFESRTDPDDADGGRR